MRRLSNPLGLLLVGSLLAGCNSTFFAEVIGQLQVSETVNDFGVDPVGVPVVHTVTLTASRADIFIGAIEIVSPSPDKAFYTAPEWLAEGFELSDDYAFWSQLPITLRRDESFEMPVIHYADSEDYRNATIILTRELGDTRSEDVEVKVRARAAKPYAVIYPRAVDFGEVPVGAVRTESVTIENRSDLPLAISASADSAVFKPDEPDPLIIAPRATDTYDITFSPLRPDPEVYEMRFSVGADPVATVRLRGNDCENGLPAAYDRDRDGFSVCGGDCDDTNPTVRPGGREGLNGDGSDNDCNGLIDDTTDGYDDDGDGYCDDTVACTEPGVLPGDCNDGDEDVNPGEVENCPGPADNCFNGIDDDCDGQVDGGTTDGDGDGYTVAAGDCDEFNPNVYPGARELPDFLDNDCDNVIDEGTVLYDDDGDGYCEGLAGTTGCSNPSFVGTGDCDDSVNPLSVVDPRPGASIHPGALESNDRWVDNDCDGEVDEGTIWSDDDGDGYTEEAGDCNDNNPNIGPFALEIPDPMGVDEDCNPATTAP